jgi:3'-phosphoadenosine 5'-phosphosulfate sulfotransferase (PAPS reductase)/FAD synthetase
VRLAKKHFPDVKVKITRNSVLNYFEKEKMIPHPILSPCSLRLKINPINDYIVLNGIEVDLIGYVKHELKRRAQGQIDATKKKEIDVVKAFPIGDFTDEWCFGVVKGYLGWYPEIYDLVWEEKDYVDGLCPKKNVGKKVFKHNNCLPCKNMNTKDFLAVRRFYPYYHKKAMELSAKLDSHWGRNKDDFYNNFGRDLGQDSTCEYCKY